MSAEQAPDPGPSVPRWTPGGEDDTRLIAARWLVSIPGAGFAIVRVPEPIPHPSGDPALADCHCGPRSSTRRRDGRCTAPGKHPDGEAWQRPGTQDERVIAGMLRNPGYQLGVMVLPGGRGFILDEDLAKGVDADMVIADWSSSTGEPAYWLGSGESARRWLLPNGHGHA